MGITWIVDGVVCAGLAVDPINLEGHCCWEYWGWGVAIDTVTGWQEVGGKEAERAEGKEAGKDVGWGDGTAACKVIGLWIWENGDRIGEG